MTLHLRTRRALLPAIALLAAVSLPAYAVSDGDYDPANQGCSPTADASDQPQQTESHCYSAVLLLGGAHHKYVQVGVPQTPDGTNANAVELCLDFTGTQKCARFDENGFSPLPDRPGTPIDPEQGEVHAYFGADDNLDSGEHDESEQVANGPSDGGGIQANVTPMNVADWLTHVMAGDSQYVLTHPLPAADFGTGACADGLCISVQTMRRIAYTAGREKDEDGNYTSPEPQTRDASNYDGHTWDPPSCAGPSDTEADCGDGHPMSWWHTHNQTTYVEPGIQIYEDPDPQGSPEGPYPLPAIYVGTCGFVAGGGTAPPFPASPFTNASGQLLLETGC